MLSCQFVLDHSSETTVDAVHTSFLSNNATECHAIPQKLIQSAQLLMQVWVCLQADANAAKSSLRVLVNVGKAEVELLRTTQEGSSDRNSLARFMIGGLWVSYRMTYGGESSAIELLASSIGRILREHRGHMTTISCATGLTCTRMRYW